MKKILVFLLFLPMFSIAQSNDFRMLANADSTMIVNILSGLEESEDVSIHTMKAYKSNNGRQRVFVWWKIDGIKRDWTRGVITIDRTIDGVIGYSIDSNRKHPKFDQLNDASYISKILQNI